MTATKMILDYYVKRWDEMAKNLAPYFPIWDDEVVSFTDLYTRARVLDAAQIDPLRLKLRELAEKVGITDEIGLI